MYSLVFVTVRSYVAVSEWFTTVDAVAEDWQTFFAVIWYLAICAPVALLYQVVLSGNRLDSTPADCWLSAAVSLALALASRISAGYEVSSADDTVVVLVVLESVCVAGFGLSAMFNASFALGLERHFPKFLGRHHEELCRARLDYCRLRLKQRSDLPPRDTPVTVFPDPRLRLEPVEILLREGDRIEDCFPAPAAAVVEDEDDGRWSLVHFLGMPKPWPFGYLRRSRPPILYVSALVALLLIAVLAYVMIIMDFNMFRKIASDLNDIARYLEGLDEEDEILQDAVDKLDSSASLLKVLEHDWNRCWIFAVGISVAIMVLVTCTIVPRFDRASELVKTGAPLHLREGGGAQEALLGQATALFGATISVAIIGLFLNTFVITCIIYVFVSDMIREAIWRYRYFILSFGISFIIKGFILQPYLFHKAASDGHRLVRFNLFMICDIAWTAYNVIIGVTIALIRAAYYVLFVVSAVAILDYTILPPSLSVYDTAHNAFVAAVWAHHRHHHPVLHVAVEALREELKKASPRRSRATKRWHLTYTLLNNPKLMRERKIWIATESKALDDGAAVEKPDSKTSFSEESSTVAARV